MATRLAHFTLPVERVQRTLDRLQEERALSGSVTLRGIGGNAICAATGVDHDVMLLIGGLAAEGEAGLLSVESC